MTRVSLFFLIMIAVISGSCSSRKKKLDRSDIIPEKDMIAIVKDIYLTNAMLNLPVVHNWYIPPDSLSTYNDVIGKYGYTKEAMDKTLKFYFVKKPKELVKIFDQALGSFSATDSRIEKALNIELGKALNLWKGSDVILYPELSGTDSTSFRLIVRPGTYLFTYQLTLFPDDNSINPHMSAWYSRADSADTGKRYWFKTLNYVKDGLPHRYTSKIFIPGKAFVTIKGCIYDYDKYPPDFLRHLRLEKISFTNISTQ